MPSKSRSWIRVRAAQIGAHELDCLRTEEVGIGPGTGLPARSGRRQIGNRRKRNRCIHLLSNDGFRAKCFSRVAA